MLVRLQHKHLISIFSGKSAVAISIIQRDPGLPQVFVQSLVPDYVRSP